MARTPADPCFFVLGYGRSGTTLFRRMLSAHPSLFVAPENDIFQRLPLQAAQGIRDAEQLQEVVSAFPAYYHRIYDLDRFVADAADQFPFTLAEAISILQGVSRIGIDRPNAQWGHKAPSEWPFIGTWREWYPHARYVHIVRHPHDATASMVEYQLQRYRTTALVGIWQWRKAFRAIRRHGAELGPERYLMIQYEDLVADPRAVLTEVCRFLGVSTDEIPRMVDFTSDPSAAHVDEGVHMARAETAVTAERIGRAVGDHSTREAAMLDYVCRNELRELGYDPRAPRPAGAAQRAAYGASCRALDAAWAGVRATRRARGQL